MLDFPEGDLLTNHACGRTRDSSLPRVASGLRMDGPGGRNGFFRRGIRLSFARVPRRGGLTGL